MSEFSENYTILERPDSTDFFFNTLSDDEMLIRKIHRRQVWAVVEDGDTVYVAPGRAHPNAIKYFVTLEGWERRNERYFLSE